MKLSIIVPMYNSEKTIKKCIDSIINDKVDFPFEVIIINDGSTDNSMQLINTYYKDISFIKLINKTNGGVSTARNEGLKNSNSEFIMFLDSDDFLVENWSQKIIKCINKNCDWIVFSKNSNENYNEKIFYSDIIGINSQYRLSCVWSKLYKRSIILENKIFFNNDIINGEDLLFNLEYFGHCNNYIFINDSIYYYYINNNSVTNKFDKKFVQSDLVFQKKLEEIIEKNKLDTEYSFFSKTNAMLVLINRYSLNKKFIYSDIENLFSNPYYIGELKNKILLKKYYNLNKRIILYFIRKKQIKFLYFVLKIKNMIKRKLKNKIDILERI